MSLFEDYNTISLRYDETRSPPGVTSYASKLPQLTGKGLSELHVLDAGCGTGNYAKELLDAGLGKVTCLDANSGMLSKAKLKLNEYVKQGRVGFIEAVLPDMPINYESIDVVMFNFVLHHVESDYVNYSKTRETMVNVCKQLSSRVIVCIAAFTPQQLRESLWFYKLLPERIMQRGEKMFIQRKDLEPILQEVGFNSYENLMICESVLSEDDYYNHTAILNKSWRSNLSLWNLLTAEEDKFFESNIRELIDSGEWAEIVAVCESRRKAIGDCCLSFAYNVI